MVGGQKSDMVVLEGFRVEASTVKIMIILNQNPRYKVRTREMRKFRSVEKLHH